MTTTFRYNSNGIRVRVRGGLPVWFVRDVAVALGIRHSAGPLVPASAHSLPGIATTEQVLTLLDAAGCPVDDAFGTWMSEVSAQVTASPTLRSVPPTVRPRTAHHRRTAAA
ncbi:hypothetical protein G3I60_05020 [Streptomyces sp. SID13666]|uniref:hypothetical protein n=1 Tax=Streptomyces sp. SID13666 TaxID=2706054 RepID=UPI0013C17649|nr:hypothetical protein [Streptomyces sp. SID13666]NEA53531.1 hypothetical protein [Streptomyces sp. SID13666]